MRLIDADKLKEKLINLEPMVDGLVVFEEDIDNAPTIEQHTWISVKEKLPEHLSNVLGLCKDGTMFVGRILRYELNVNVWEIYTAMHSTRQMKKTVTHWMPLPEEPKQLEEKYHQITMDEYLESIENGE